MTDLTFHSDFRYKHNNLYHHKLGEFEKFVLRDHDAEIQKGKWQTDIFKNQNPIHVEIGTGYGHFMLDYIQENPNANFIGLDYRFKRSFHLAKKLAKLGNENFRYLRAKGERLEFMFEKNEVERLFYFFPDPWPKTKHNKKRLFQLPFLKSAYQVLAPGGKLYVKTDHVDYAIWMKKVLQDNPYFTIELETLDLRKDFPDHFLSQFATKFEKIFIKQNVAINAFVLVSKKEVKEGVH
jgi:tRNA (guanine-N7-)-methyltransferase